MYTYRERQTDGLSETERDFKELAHMLVGQARLKPVAAKGLEHRGKS